MNPLDTDARLERERADKERAKSAERRFREDVQAFLGNEAGRRLLWSFLQDAGVDVSAFRESPQSMAHAVGWQDAGGWWLDKIRRYCPEREAQMRKEAKQDQPKDEEPNGD